MSHHHTPTPLESQIMEKCFKRSSLVLKAGSCQEILAKLEPDLLAKVNEVQNQPKAEKERDKKALESALQTLAQERIKPGPVPVPRSVWKSMLNNSYGQVATTNADKMFPHLNAATEKALVAKADPYDQRHEEWMLELGNYLAGNFTSKEMVGFIRDLGHFDLNPTKLPKERRVAQLAYDLIEDARCCTGFQTFQHTADMLWYLSKDEIQQEAELAGFDGNGTKVEVVVRLIELFYADVLVPKTE